MTRRMAWLLAGGWLALLAAGVLAVHFSAPRERLLAGFATPLVSRTPSQVHNARLAARAIDGRVLRPGQILSFNRCLAGWDAQRGYVKAPVSYDGRVIDAWGGGVCQVSTTLYNAALLAGLEVEERHRHHWPPRYVPPGRDAAVAYPQLDLRLRNPYPWPVRVQAAVAGDRLQVHLRGRGPARHAVVTSRVLQTIPPLVEYDPGWPGGSRVRRQGCPGFRVRVYRAFADRQELVSEDYYPPLSQVLTARATR